MAFLAASLCGIGNSTADDEATADAAVVCGWGARISVLTTGVEPVGDEVGTTGEVPNNGLAMADHGAEGDDLVLNRSKGDSSLEVPVLGAPKGDGVLLNRGTAEVPEPKVGMEAPEPKTGTDEREPKTGTDELAAAPRDDGAPKSGMAVAEPNGADDNPEVGLEGGPKLISKPALAAEDSETVPKPE